MPTIGTASTRVPFRAESTPPRPSRPSVRLHSPSPIRGSLHVSNSDYPESPTRAPKRLPSPSQTRPPPSYVLTKPKGKWRPPRFWRTTRRVILSLLVLGLVLGLTRGAVPIPGVKDGALLRRMQARWKGEELDHGVCRFVSPVEAYQRDLARLRRLYPHKISSLPPQIPNLADIATITNHTDHINETDFAPEQHVFSHTGHLHISSNPDAPHPIPLLLALGENRWEQLLSRQSQTLEEAVAEYTRRYGRRPPKGFDIWWDFAMTHNLVLPDEYDRINLDLAPFFALPKEEMKRRMIMVENMPETFTLVVRDGRVDVQILDPGGLKWDGTWPRARDASSILDVFARFLPDLRATFSIFDQPQIYLSWARRDSLVDLGLRGEHTTHLQETDSAHVRLARSCPPDSNLRTNGTAYPGRSFIYDSLEAGDLCQNPYVVPLHGLTLEPHGHDSHPRPHTQLLPLFSLAKTSINSDILITPLDQFHDQPGKDPKWEDKTSSKLAWRGSPTGMSMMSKDLDWRQAHRIRLHHFANNHSTDPQTFMVPDLGQDIDIIEQPRNDLSQPAKEALGAKVDEEMTNEAAEFFFDTKLAGGPLQCSDGDGTCTDMWDEIEFAPYQPPEELNKHKFLLDIDGNGWSGRFRRLMSTNSVVIKASLFTEWFQPHLIPWFMYIPAKLDFSDLTDILAFFRGSPKHPDLAFDETAKALAINGKCFAERMFRIEDLQAYMMRLFLEYARIAADEGIDMDFYLDDEEPESEYIAEYHGIDNESAVEEFPVPKDDNGNDLLVEDPSRIETPLDHEKHEVETEIHDEPQKSWFSFGKTQKQGGVRTKEDLLDIERKIMAYRNMENSGSNIKTIDDLVDIKSKILAYQTGGEGKRGNRMRESLTDVKRKILAYHEPKLGGSHWEEGLLRKRSMGFEDQAGESDSEL